MALGRTIIYSYINILAYFTVDVVDDGADVGVNMTACSTSRLHNLSQSHVAVNRTQNHRPSSSTAPVATMPLLPFPGAFPGGFCGLSPTQLTPLQMCPPYIFMGFPLHPQLLQSYPVAAADLPAPHQPANPAKRKSTQPMSSPSDEKVYRPSHTRPALHSVGHVAYLPIVTAPPTHDESRDRKHLVMASSMGGGGSADSRQGAGEFDQDGALDLTKK